MTMTKTIRLITTEVLAADGVDILWFIGIHTDLVLFACCNGSGYRSLALFCLDCWLSLYSGAFGTVSSATLNPSSVSISILMGMACIWVREKNRGAREGLTKNKCSNTLFRKMEC